MQRSWRPLHARARDYNYHRLYDEDLDLYGDGSIEILFSPAHTRGEQALIVRLPNTGTIVMPAGVIPQKANWDRDVITGTPCVDPTVVERSMRRLKRIEEDEDALVLFHTTRKTGRPTGWHLTTTTEMSLHSRFGRYSSVVNVQAPSAFTTIKMAPGSMRTVPSYAPMSLTSRSLPSALHAQTTN